MGRFLLWFQCDDVAELEKARQKKLECIADLQEEVRAIDEKISKLKG